MSKFIKRLKKARKRKGMKKYSVYSHQGKYIGDVVAKSGKRAKEKVARRLKIVEEMS